MGPVAPWGEAHRGGRRYQERLPKPNEKESEQRSFHFAPNCDSWFLHKDAQASQGCAAWEPGPRRLRGHLGLGPQHLHGPSQLPGHPRTPQQVPGPGGTKRPAEKEGGRQASGPLPASRGSWLPVGPLECSCLGALKGSWTAHRTRESATRSTPARPCLWWTRARPWPGWG